MTERVVIGNAELWHGDCREVLKTLPSASVDSIVTDPPYHLTTGKKGGSGPASVTLANPYGRARIGTGFMGMKWDGGDVAQDPAVWAECLRVLKPGGYLLAFSGTRTQHRMVCAIEDAGFEIRDMIAWVYGSGFPKSHNGAWGGTALKPALEPITMARKPLIGTVAANVLAHGTGGLNIDGCRVTTNGEQVPVFDTAGGRKFEQTHTQPERRTQQVGSSDLGRWPANLIHDGSDEVLAAFPAQAGASAPIRGTEPSVPAKGDVAYGFRARVAATFHGDTGSAARFFYCAKASRADRNDGCEGLEERYAARGNGFSDKLSDTKIPRANQHPTVKPTDLMRYLCRLVTPPGGTVLDPFMGSGSTLKAAELEGFRAIGIDLSAEYIEIARRRYGADAPLFAQEQGALL